MGKDAAESSAIRKRNKAISLMRESKFRQEEYLGKNEEGQIMSFEMKERVPR